MGKAVGLGQPDRGAVHHPKTAANWQGPRESDGRLAAVRMARFLRHDRHRLRRDRRRLFHRCDARLGTEGADRRLARLHHADGGESDVFVHISAVEVAGMDTLVAGQFLAYDIGTARDGRSKAINLRLLNPDGHYGARD